MNRTNRMVIRTLTAVFDGECLRLDEPHDLALLADRRYLIAVQADPLPAGAGVAWDARDATPAPADVPPAWSNAHSHRLYGRAGG
ncbi:MAG: hypothetical protein M3Z04_16810 [Chloroflexota bacterium]|nr:hypothetical protein [Chloroflexota bacterium]